MDVEQQKNERDDAEAEVANTKTTKETYLRFLFYCTRLKGDHPIRFPFFSFLESVVTHLNHSDRHSDARILLLIEFCRHDSKTTEMNEKEQEIVVCKKSVLGNNYNYV